MSGRNPLRELARFGVSVWYDNISRALLDGGELARLIAEDGVSGVTSNPTIFEKAIGGGQDYDEAIRRLAREGKSPAEIFEQLAVADIRAAAELFRPIYEESRGADGYVSLELPPQLAHDADGSCAEAARLSALVDRPNAMIKIPGTAAGVRAVERAIAGGINVNVTLLFAQGRYAEVVEAYLRGLEARAAKDQDLRRIASVASFFVSRVDTAVDAQLEGLGAAARALRGRAAVANAKLAYQIFLREFSSSRFAALKARGARPQRLLWASTSTKNPRYRDVVYVEELIGADTVNTMPPATVDAFRDHGACRPSLGEDVAAAREAWRALAAAGVDLDGVARRLEDEGVKAFAGSFETLLGRIAAKMEMIAAESDRKGSAASRPDPDAIYASGSGVVEDGLAALQKALFSSRLWSRDASLWKKHDPAHQRVIRQSLGWLSAPEAMAAGLGPVRAFAAETADEFSSAVVLGMGGSSLACEVFRSCFPRAPGRPQLEVLDTTNPAAIAALERRLDLRRTLFIVASKSGSTLEPNCMLEYFWARVEQAAPREAGRRFVAITDPGTSLESLARGRGFRRVFINPSDIGGRFSALSLFGLVPAALAGVDVERLLTRAREAARELSASVPTGDNPALRLGAALARHAARGQDKLTLSLPPAIESLGLWIEQLVAESTGKEGRGVVPVHGEPLRAPSAYAKDRLFVRLELADQPDPAAAASLSALGGAGHPTLALRLRDAYDLGAQFLLWEIATAAAGFLLDVDPFDQPDVSTAKEQTRRLLDSLEGGRLPAEKAALRAGGWAAHADPALAARWATGPMDLPLSDLLSAHWSRLRPGDYAAVLVFGDPSEDGRRGLDEILRRLRELARCPVLAQWGPRYLHSTGQLFKGGPDRGVFLMLVEPDPAPLAVPGQPYTFGTLHRAQARGDFMALLAAGRRALRLELPAAGARPYAALANALDRIRESAAHQT